MPAKNREPCLPAFWQKYGHDRSKLIVTSLVFLAAGQSEAASVAKRFQAFMAAHPSLSVECTISGSEGRGTATLTIRRQKRKVVKVDWTERLGADSFRFVTDGVTGIETVPAVGEYDRKPEPAQPFPEGRIHSTFGFPYVLVAGSAQFFTAPATKLTHK